LIAIRRDARQIKDHLEKESRFTPIASMQVLMVTGHAVSNFKYYQQNSERMLNAMLISDLHAIT